MTGYLWGDLLDFDTFLYQSFVYKIFLSDFSHKPFVYGII